MYYWRVKQQKKGVSRPTPMDYVTIFCHQVRQ